VMYSGGTVVVIRLQLKKKRPFPLLLCFYFDPPTPYHPHTFLPLLSLYFHSSPFFPPSLSSRLLPTSCTPGFL
jgi:hypothetical protein